MWSKDYKKVKNIVKVTGPKYSPEFEIDFDQLLDITNGYTKFVDKIKENYQEGKDSFRNVVVFKNEEIHTFGPQEGETVTKIFVVFDHHDTYIRLFGCNTNHQRFPHIHEFSQNKIFVSMMSKLL